MGIRMHGRGLSSDAYQFNITFIAVKPTATGSTRV